MTQTNRIFAWADSPLAPTGFGRSSKHVLGALHEAGYRITQLAVNADPMTLKEIPWRVMVPTDRANDPYGLNDLGNLLQHERFDMMWSTFDPEVPWYYGAGEQRRAAIDLLTELRFKNPGFKMAGWFPVDGGPLSDKELGVLGIGPHFDIPVTMSPHVYELIEWTMKLRGHNPDSEAIRKRLRLIPHAVELDNYPVVTDELRREARGALGLPQDAFIILQLERNQQRKQNYLALEAMEILLRRKPNLRGKVVLYQHMLTNEESAGSMLGYDLPELAWRYGLQPGRDVFWPPGFVPEEDMHRRIYGCADAFLSVSTGEGFQYPAWEALACGLPIVVPNDSARKAWFTGVPNVHLYTTQDRRLVLRGGYRRRMGMADPAAAATTLLKMIEGRPKHRPQPEAGRAFVEKTAALDKVKGAWVEVFAEMEQSLIADRRGSRIAVPGNPTPDRVLAFRRKPGVGDLLMAGPALRALREGGEYLRLHVLREQLEIAIMADLADEFSTEAPPPSADDLSSLFFPQHRHGWSEPTKPRQEVFAQHLGVTPGRMRPFTAEAPSAAVQQVGAQFLEGFGVGLEKCVAINLDAGNPTRSLPVGYLPHLVAAIKARDLVPLLVGPRALQCRLHGVIDMTGQTDLPTVATVLGQVQALITGDTGAMHMAAMQGTPLVVAFNLFAPEARLAYYDTEYQALTPLEPINGATFPVGLATDKVEPQEWFSQISAARIAAALGRLLGDEPAAERAAKAWGTK